MSLTAQQVRHVKEIVVDIESMCPVRTQMDTLTSEIKDFKEAFIEFKTKIDTIATILVKIFTLMGGIAGIGTLIGIALKVAGKI